MNKKESNFISAVVYLSDDAENAKSFIEELLIGLKTYFQHYELIIVDDCCKKQDALLKKLLPDESNNMITVIHMSVNQGVEACLTAGLDVSIGDFVFEFDSVEFSISKEILWSVYEKALEGNDVVSVETTCNSLSRRLFYKMFNKFSDSIYDIQASAFRLVSRRAINRVLDLKISSSFRQAMYSSCGLKNAKIDFIGKANPKKSRNFNLAIDSFILYTRVPYVISSFSINTFIVFLVLGILSFLMYVLRYNSLYMDIFVISLFIQVCIISLNSIVNMYYNRLILKEANKKYLFESIEKIQKRGVN